jgi:hypothetical protein
MEYAVLASVACAAEPPLSCTIVGTGQTKCFDNRSEIAPPKPGQPFYWQDARHEDAIARAAKATREAAVT